MRRSLAARAVSFLAGSLLAVLFVIIFAQIVMRTLGRPFIWAEEASVIGFIWLVFAGAALAWQRVENLEVDLVYLALAAKLSKAQKRIWEIGIALFSMMFLGVFGVGLAIMTRQTWTVSMGALEGFRFGWIYLGVLAAVLVALAILAARVINGAAPEDQQP